MNKQASLNFLRKLRAELREMSDDEFLRQFAELSKPDEGEGEIRKSERDSIRAEIASGGTSCHWCKAETERAARAQAEALAQALDRLYNAADIYAADQTGNLDPRCGAVQPVTREEAQELNDALQQARDVRAGNPLRKTVPLAMLQGVSNIAYSAGESRGNVSTADLRSVADLHGYEVTE